MTNHPFPERAQAAEAMPYYRLSIRHLAGWDVSGGGNDRAELEAFASRCFPGKEFKIAPMTERTAYVIEVDGGIWGWTVCRHTAGGMRIFLAERAAQWWAEANLQHAFRIVPRQVVA